jgi:eukaryotic-like serine/threonine-protein kinase
VFSSEACVEKGIYDGPASAIGSRDAAVVGHGVNQAAEEFADRVAALYRQALQAPLEERARIVAEAAGADGALRAEVERLLAQHPTEAAIDGSSAALRPGSRVGAYVVEARIGAGGMGDVFRALDTRLNRKVAIKVCSSGFGERFEREARALSALNHPHVCTLFDVGPDYLVMELIDGETLATRLERGVLSLAEAVRFGAEIADALAEAHRAGIVHRDLKPQNVMLTRHGVKVLDFGIAKLPKHEGLTQTGAIIGTAAYLAPEQIAGEPATMRSDLYALGVVLHEMIVGRRPASSASAAKAILRAVEAAGDASDGTLGNLVAHLLHADPASRPASAAEVAGQLRTLGARPRSRDVGSARRVAVGVAIIAAVGLASWLLNRSDRPVSPSPGAVDSAVSGAVSAARAVPVASVAVMPFANLTNDPDKDYFAEGMAEELINALAKVPDLKVASRTSSFAYKGREADIRDIAKDLGVATILEGSVRSAGDRIRLTAQLTNAASGYHLWSESFDRDFNGLFELQDDLARQIVDAFRRTMSIDPAGLVRRARSTTANLDAYVTYLRVVHAAGNYSLEGQRAAVEDLKQVVQIDPNFAQALGLLGMMISNVPETPLEEAEQYARRAHALDPAQGNDTLITVQARRGRWIEAEEVFRSLPADSIDPTTYTYHATTVLWPLGRVQDAQREYARTAALAPAVPGALSNLARIEATLGHEPEAVRLAERSAALGQDTKTWQTREIYYHNALYAGRHDEAGRLAAEFLSPDLRTAESEATLRLAHAAIGDASARDAATTALRELAARIKPADVVAKSFMLSWLTQVDALDDAYALAEALRMDFGGRAPVRAWAWLWYPEMSAFRRNSRFQGFVTRLGMLSFWEKYGPPDACKLDGGTLTCQ